MTKLLSFRDKIVYFALPMSTALSDPVVPNLADPMLRKSFSRKGNPVLWTGLGGCYESFYM